MTASLGGLKVDVLRHAHTLRNTQAPIQEVANTLEDTVSSLGAVLYGTSRADADDALSATLHAQGLLRNARDAIAHAANQAEALGRAL